MIPMRRGSDGRRRASNGTLDLFDDLFLFMLFSFEDSLGVLSPMEGIHGLAYKGGEVQEYGDPVKKLTQRKRSTSVRIVHSFVHSSVKSIKKREIG